MGLLDGKTAVVTGAGRGIGRGIALALAKAGAKVVVNDLGTGLDGEGAATGPAAAVVDEIVKAGGTAAANFGSVANYTQATEMVEQAVKAWGRIDILVNVAGILRDRMIFNMAKEEWDAVLAVHLDGTFFCTREALRLMSRRNQGAIVNMSSVAAWGLESVPHYSAAKAGILGFTRAVAREVGSRKIRVNAICPGFIDTPMTQPMSDLMRRATINRTPLGRYAEPAEVAKTALFLASDDSSFFTGQWLSPNGGLFIG